MKVALSDIHIWGCIQNFPDWPRGARTANATTLCHWVQLYRYFVSQSSEFCHHNPLCCFSTRVYCCCCCCLFRYRVSSETFGYTIVFCTRDKVSWKFNRMWTRIFQTTVLNSDCHENKSGQWKFTESNEVPKFYTSSLMCYFGLTDIEKGFCTQEDSSQRGTYESVSKSFRTGRLERELQMVQLSATRCSCIAILWVGLVSFAAITLCVASQRVFIIIIIIIIIVVYFVMTQSGNLWIHPHNATIQNPLNNM
jgi:hypothetical protein